MAVSSYLDIRKIEFKGKRVFLRLDLNVPIKNGKVLDDNRIVEALPTLKFLLEQGAKVIVASHLGRPKGIEDRDKYSLEPVAHVLNQMGFEVLLMETPDSEAPYELVKSLGDSEIILLENLRFHEGETKNSGELAAKWSRYTDIYVNDAFGASHRAHASIDALAKLIPQRCYGFLIEKEIKALEKIKSNPPQPFVLITGGSKVSDKIPLLESFSERANSVIIGGAMAYTFMKVQGISVGKSLVEKEMLTTAQNFLNRMAMAGKKVYLPIDHIVVPTFESSDFSTTPDSSIPQEQIAVDIGPQTRILFTQVIQKAGSVFWNGPMGVYEKKPFDQGSLAIAKALAESQAFSVVGGGDSAAAAIDSGFADKIDHISTGGGASLEFIQGIKLPGLEALKVRIAE